MTSGRFAVALVAAVLLLARPAAADVKPKPRSERYRKLQAELARGWNTWSTHNLLQHVLLPEGLAVSLGVKPTWLSGKFLGSALRDGGARPKVRPGLRTDDGRYTSLELDHENVALKVESATDGGDLVLLVHATMPADRLPNLIVDGALLWNRPGTVTREGDRLVATLPGGRTISIGTTGVVTSDFNVPVRGPYLALAMGGAQAGPQRLAEPGDPRQAPRTTNEIGIFTGRPRTVKEIRAIVEHERAALARTHARWKDLAESFQAMQTALAWNVIYDPENDRVISPVSRSWSVNFGGGYVLFDWDTYFAAVMYGAYNKPLAYANAVEITKAITAAGFIPNWIKAYGLQSIMRSQPPVGSRMVLEIFRRHKERWFLEEVFDELVTWNRWWPQNRANGAWLSWGSEVPPPTTAEDDKKARQHAKWESGLDNSPTFDDVPIVPGRSILALGDVGLTSLYVMDCDALAEIAHALGRGAERDELRARADRYRRSLQALWSEEKGIFLSRRTDTEQRSTRLGPMNLFPLIARAATPVQAARMMKDHYFNTATFHGKYVLPSITRDDPAFKENFYWRGRIWAPLNFLVYLGLRNYDVSAARKDLVERSRALLLEGWRASRAVHENYNATTGAGGDVTSSDSLYHWGALLGLIGFMERGVY